MPEIKNTFLKGKMNKDLDDRLLPNGEYRDAQNITVSKSELSDVGTVQNVKGNDKLFNDNLNVTSNTKTIGHYIDSLTGEIFWFISNFSGSGSESLSDVQYAPVSENSVDTVCKILYAKTDGASPQVLIDSFRLNLSKNHRITHVNRLDNLLFWTDNYNQPRRLNIENALMSYAEDNISSDKKAQTDLDKSWNTIINYIAKEGEYNEKAKDILWEYISDKDIPEIEERLSNV